MIEHDCFKKSWIDDKRQELRVMDPGLLEKCIHGLQLLGRLSEEGGEFVFKGGTSLILLLANLRRLSIDIDIVSNAAPAEYKPVLERIGGTSPFIRFGEDDRGADRLPKRQHFKFFYNSIYSQREDYVLLDILEEENHFPETKVLPIRTPFIEVERDVEVRVPTIDCLTGDKLTAFAPNTVGIPLKPNYSMKVAKQVFDVGELFNVVENLEMVKRTHAAIFAAENGYRDFQFSLDQALDDTIAAAALICQVNLKGGIADDRTRLIQNGISRIASHLVGGRYNIDDARVSAAKAACLAAILKQDTISLAIENIRFNQSRVEELRGVKIEKWPVLNRLKAISPEAFQYWFLVDRLGRS
ncbi:MAG: nucleotidyl transferase AbiEii/AbiGii toxin family protein [Chloroflexi bacterium]|nr:nucleotidyl transferase AbiEii/AbiGii toxin family protein [Chloroflexota bacterium]